MKIGFKIRQLREEKNISQEDLAFKLNISQSKLSKIENDRLKAKLPLLIKIFTAFDLNMNDLAKFIQDFY